MFEREFLALVKKYSLVFNENKNSKQNDESNGKSTQTQEAKGNGN